MNKDIAKKEDNSISRLYNNNVSIGTEEMGQGDLNTPILKVIQPNTQNILGKTDGWFYRSDTQSQIDEVEVNFVYVTSQEVENFNRTGKEIVKIYYGFYKDTNEPFKMFCRGWALGAHRLFQTQVARIKGKFHIPMLALTVKLTTEQQQGTLPDSGKPYIVYKPVFTILKNEEGNAPLVLENQERVNFLVESANRFRELAQGSLVTAHDVEQNETLQETENTEDNLVNQETKEDVINPEDIPF